MPCYGPLTAYRPAAGANSRRLVFDKRKSHSGIPIPVPCGQCIGCKLERSRQWALRMTHELRTQDPLSSSSFVTLTYRDRDLPANFSLDKPAYINFLKRLRDQTGPGLRFFGCGEYGEKSLRPHYHFIFFNYRPTDLKILRRDNEGNHLYDSKFLETLWPYGNNAVGDVSFDSCAYVARYCTKKITGPQAAEHYQGRTPEFTTMSRRPGIGSEYYQKYKDELLAHDTVIANGVPCSPPRYYDKKTENSDANMRRGLDKTILETLKMKRRAKIATATAKADNTSRRRYVREKVQMAKLKQKARTL